MLSQRLRESPTWHPVVSHKFKGKGGEMIPCVIHDGVQAMSDGQDRTVLKLRADGGLNEVVGLHVHSGCGFV